MVSQDEIKKIVMEKVIKPVVDQKLVDDETKYLINPSGSVRSGADPGAIPVQPAARSLLIPMADMHRSAAAVLSSKDPTKVDRSAAYYARYVMPQHCCQWLST
jgi:S-adenosylmethionine synthetase